MIALVFARVATAQDATDAGPPPVGRLRELDHPAYVDEAGTVLTWSQVRDLAAPTDALDRVRRRREGRVALHAGFLAATALETWGTWELARQESLVAIPLGVQAGFTGLCEVLMWTRIPTDRRRDRAIVLDAVNAR